MWGQGGTLKNSDRLVIWHASLNHVGFHSGNKLMKNKDKHSSTRFKAFSATKHTRTK